MTSARKPLPTDLVALVSFDGRVHPNEAKPLDHLGVDDRAHPLEGALEQWFSFATGKHTWVSVRGATIRGLISARERAKRSAWEVDALIDVDEDEGVALSLLSRMTAGVMKQKAERVFLRLEEESHLGQAVRKAEFFPFMRETLYRLDGKPGFQLTEVPFRPREKPDLMGAFQLYSQAVPANVRAIEGATFREWQAAQESWGGRTTELVLEEDGIITAWLRIQTGQTGRLALVARSERWATQEVVQAALARLHKSKHLLCLVPDHDGPLASCLGRLGFEPVSSYAHYARRLVKPVEELVAETAGQAVPVS
jgi:hypothetical protein